MKKFETIKLAEASPEQIRDFGKKFLGVETDGLSDSEVLAKVTAAHEGDTIFCEIASPATDQSGTPPPPAETKTGSGGIVGSLGRNDPKVTLTLHAEERDGVVYNRHKEVGVGGVVWLLKRGEPITIPYRVYEALNNAERHVITHTSEGEVREQVVKNTPFNIISMPSAEELKAWHDETDNQFVP